MNEANITETKRALERRDENGVGFRLLFSNNPHPMYVCDRESLQFLEVNDAAVAQYGYSREEFLALTLADIRPAEEIPRLLDALEHISPGVSHEGEWRHRRKNGELFDVEITVHSLEFAGRAAMLAVAQDITARKQAEKKIAEQTAYLSALTENNPLAIVALDVRHHVKMCNRAFEKLFGYPREEILCRRLDDLIAPEGPEEEASELSGRPGQGEILRGETKRVKKDGAAVDVQVTAVPLISDGQFIGSFAMYEDITERKRAEQARMRAEERYRSLFENSVEGIFQTTPDGRYISANPALARTCGYSSAEEMMADVRDIGRQLYVDPARRDDFKRILERQGDVKGFEYELRRRDGMAVWVTENARAVRDSAGRILYYEGSLEDISDRKRAELERQASFEITHGVNVTENLDELFALIHRTLRKVLSAENCFIALHELATGTFHFPFFVDQFDTAPAPQAVGRSCTAYVFRTGRAMLIPQSVFEELAAQGELELVGTNSPSWLGVPLRTPSATIGVLVVQHYEKENAYSERDLEFLASVGGQIAVAIERKRAETALRESEERLRVLVEQLPAVLWTIDTHLRFTSSLGAGLTQLGLKPNEVVGMSLYEYFQTTDPQFPMIASCQRAIQGESVTFSTEWGGHSYTCHVESLRGADGQIQGAIGMALDITDRRKLEDQLRQAQKMEAVGRLAGGIAHDFNNLLMVIQGYAELLMERTPSGDPHRKNAEQIREATQRAAALTRQLLAFSRRQMLAPTILNVQHVVGDMEKILRRLIGEDVELVTVSVPDLWNVRADRSQVEQVIMNLAVNGRDAMPQGGKLTLETANVEFDSRALQRHAVLEPGPYVMLAVTDNGCGMDAETMAHIFEPFFTTKDKAHGTGLGLATVYGIVKQSGGYIWVYSEPHKGTTFKVYFPRAEGEVAARERRPELPSDTHGTETILLVEDESGVRELASDYLERNGYKVLSAEDGGKAVELAGAHTGPIHLLMTDLVMPGMSGRELAAKIAAARPGIRVLYMSGYTDQSVVWNGELGPGAVLLQKPFTLNALAHKIRETLTSNP